MAASHHTFNILQRIMVYLEMLLTSHQLVTVSKNSCQDVFFLLQQHPDGTHVLMSAHCPTGLPQCVPQQWTGRNGDHTSLQLNKLRS